MGQKQFGIDNDRLSSYAKEIKEIHDLGVEIAIVIGGGNIFRGVQAEEGRARARCRGLVRKNALARRPHHAQTLRRHASCRWPATLFQASHRAPPASAPRRRAAG